MPVFLKNKKSCSSRPPIVPLTIDAALTGGRPGHSEQSSLKMLIRSAEFLTALVSWTGSTEWWMQYRCCLSSVDYSLARESPQQCSELYRTPYSSWRIRCQCSSYDPSCSAKPPTFLTQPGLRDTLVACACAYSRREAQPLTTSSLGNQIIIGRRQSSIHARSTTQNCTQARGSEWSHQFRCVLFRSFASWHSSDICTFRYICNQTDNFCMNHNFIRPAGRGNMETLQTPCCRRAVHQMFVNTAVL